MSILVNNNHILFGTGLHVERLVELDSRSTAFVTSTWF